MAQRKLSEGVETGHSLQRMGTSLRGRLKEAAGTEKGRGAGPACCLLACLPLLGPHTGEIHPHLPQPGGRRTGLEEGVFGHRFAQWLLEGRNSHLSLLLPSQTDSLDSSWQGQCVDLTAAPSLVPGQERGQHWKVLGNQVKPWAPWGWPRS